MITSKNSGTSTLRYSLYHLFLTGAIKSVSELELLLEFLLEDIKYPIFYGNDSNKLVEGLGEELFLIRKVQSPADAMIVWQVCRHVSYYLTMQQQQELLEYLLNLAVPLDL